MAEIFSPTPYADVNRVLHQFLELIQSILADQFIGFYLYGSLALGDFDPQTSDMDFLVVTKDGIGDDQFAALQEMHARFDRGSSPWARKIEAAYLPLGALGFPPPEPALYPQIEKGTSLVRAPLEDGWAFQRHTLRERAVIVAGPPPGGLAAPVDREEMRRAAEVILGGWQRQSRRDPSWLAWARKRGAQAFMVLTVCRIRYSLATGSVASKPAAARWAKAALPERWGGLIARALASQQDDRDGSPGELAEMLAFLQAASGELF